VRKKFSYDAETGISTCVIKGKGIVGKGKAKVHPEDKRFATQMVGAQIAEFRALKDFLDKRASKKKQEAKRLQAVAQALLDSASDDNVESVEIKLIEEEYIKAKEEFYDKIRNPKERIRWEKLDESLLSDAFKNSLQSENVIDAEIVE